MDSNAYKADRDDLSGLLPQEVIQKLLEPLLVEYSISQGRSSWLLDCSRGQSVLLSVKLLVGEVMNGGFMQAFANINRSLVHIAVDGLRELGDNTTANIAQSALDSTGSDGSKDVPASDFDDLTVAKLQRLSDQCLARLQTASVDDLLWHYIESRRSDFFTDKQSDPFHRAAVELRLAGFLMNRNRPGDLVRTRDLLAGIMLSTDPAVSDSHDGGASLSDRARSLYGNLRLLST